MFQIYKNTCKDKISNHRNGDGHGAEFSVSINSKSNDVTSNNFETCNLSEVEGVLRNLRKFEY